MKKIIIFGISDLANQLYRYLLVDDRYEVVAFTVEEKYRTEYEYFDLPVIAFEDILDFPSIKNIQILVCVGYNNMNKTRSRIFSLIKEKGLRIATYIHPLATVFSQSIGKGNIILENANVGIGSILGEGNIIYNNAVICHDVMISDFNYFSPASCVLGFTCIKNYCFIGANSTINSSITVEDGSLIGANAFLKTDSEKYSVYVPVESKKLSQKSFEMNI